MLPPNPLLTTLPNRNCYCKAHSSHILYCSRIRKKVTENREQRIENRVNRQIEKTITEATLIPWIAGLSGPIICNADFAMVLQAY